MDLFGNDLNLLPRDGMARYFGPVMPAAEADGYFMTLLRDIPWRHDETVMFGKRIVVAREVAWFGDSDFPYTYSGTTKRALPWTDELAALKALAEKRTGATFNSCLLNLYHHGGEGMGWHSDDEKSLAANSAIASLSFGAERVFRFRHKQDGEIISVLLEHGSLLVMEGPTQVHWLHAVPKSAKIKMPRINLTFRTMAVRGTGFGSGV